MYVQQLVISAVVFGILACLMYDKQEKEKDNLNMKTEFDNMINSKIAKDDNRAVQITLCFICFGLFYTYYFCINNTSASNINN